MVARGQQARLVHQALMDPPGFRDHRGYKAFKVLQEQMGFRDRLVPLAQMEQLAPKVYKGYQELTEQQAHKESRAFKE